MIKKFASFLLPVLLMTVYPILFFYTNNISELSLVFLKKPLAISVGISIFLVLVLAGIIKNREKATIMVCGGVFVFFSYGHLSRLLNKRLFVSLPGGMVLGPDKILLPIIFLLGAFFVYKTLKSKKGLSGAIKFINIVGILLVLNLGVRILINEVKKNKGEANMLRMETGEGSFEEGPDVYHIILDGYARNDVLANLYDYDNNWFTNELKKMGFFVAEKARTNYMHTYLSLPSTFNMEYLDFLPEKYGKDPVDDSVAIKMVPNNKVLQKFKSFGYQTINFVSDWGGTNESYQADVTYDEKRSFEILGLKILASETNMVFLQTTLLSPLVQEVYENALRRKTLAVFEKVPDVAYLSEKKYVLAHIMSPHPPYVFSENGGEIINEAILNNADEGIEKRPYYLDQLKFISKQTIPMLKKIMENSKKSPIIILQSDHGPASIFGKREDWTSNYSKEAVRERGSVLYAIFLPDGDYKDFPETMTPVNTYRILFNKYFGEENERLPDRTYYTSYDEIYGFYEVTEILDENN
jgi:hypothetical protein